MPAGCSLEGGASLQNGCLFEVRADELNCDRCASVVEAPGQSKRWTSGAVEDTSEAEKVRKRRLLKYVG